MIFHDFHVYEPQFKQIKEFIVYLGIKMKSSMDSSQKILNFQKRYSVNNVSQKNDFEEFQTH